MSLLPGLIFKSGILLRIPANERLFTSAIRAALQGFVGGSLLVITEGAELCTSAAGCRRLDLILNSGDFGADVDTRTDFLSSRMSRPILARTVSILFI